MKQPITPLAKDEQEQHLNRTGDNLREWVVYVDIPSEMEAMDKIAEGVHVGWGKEYRLDAEQVVFRKKRKVSEAQREAARQQMQKLNESRM